MVTIFRDSTRFVHGSTAEAGVVQINKNVDEPLRF